VDNTPPTISFSLTQRGTSIVVTGTTDINSNGINTVYELYKSLPGILSLQKTITANITDGKLNTSFGGIENGYYVVRITVKDPVGNSASMEKGIGIGGNGIILTTGSTITGPDNILQISIPPNASTSNYIVSITSESSGTDLIYKFSPKIELTKYATLTISLPATPSILNKYFVSTYDGKTNLMTKLASRVTVTHIKNIDTLYIKTIQQENSLQINFDTIVKISPMQIYLNTFEKIKISLFVLDLKGNLVKTLLNGQELNPGNTEIDWALKDKYGAPIPNGEYILYAISDKGKIAKLFGVKK